MAERSASSSTRTIAAMSRLPRQDGRSPHAAQRGMAEGQFAALQLDQRAAQCQPQASASILATARCIEAKEALAEPGEGLVANPRRAVVEHDATVLIRQLHRQTDAPTARGVTHAVLH